MNAKPILETALQIHATEATHAARIRFLRGQKGWITLTRASGLPPAASVYMGEDNVTQKEINLQSLLSGIISIKGITEAFDEPLTKDQVMAILSLS